MLASLSIRNIVLIDKLDLEFNRGLTALTGETGAGKSILLDSLSLALGARGDAGLVRAGADQGQVIAAFDVPTDHAARAALRAADMSDEGDIIIRRVQSGDGRSKAFVNDQAVSIQFLRGLGRLLVEIHGQHDDRALMDSGTHRDLLDAYAGHNALLETCRSAWRVWQELERKCRAARQHLEEAKAEEDYLRHALGELEDLDPEDGEENLLSEQRQVMMVSEKLAGDLADAMSVVSGDGASDMRIASIFRKLERRLDDVPDIIGPVTESLDQVLSALDGARMAIEEAQRAADFDPRELERVEERLFALRGLARKHNCTVDVLTDVLDRVRTELAAIDGGEAELSALVDAAREAKLAFDEVAGALSVSRKDAAERLEHSLHDELAPLKLDAARFMVRFETGVAGAHGTDEVTYDIQTNPGSKPGPLLKVASGGELSRILLALKVSLADKGSAPTLVFDEIDTAVGGAVSDAIGERLSRLAERVQVMSVTHAPQVAAKADQHLLIAKSQDKAASTTATEVKILSDDARQEEIARMLSGASITQEARAAAGKLMAAGG